MSEASTILATRDLDEILRILGNLRRLSREKRYEGAAPRRLPSRRAAADAVQGLVAALYPRHFGPPDLHLDAADAFIARTLEQALAELREQIRLELDLTGFDEQETPETHARRAQAITAAFAQTLPKVRALLDTDIEAAFSGDPAAHSIDEVISCYPGVSALIKHRLAHELYKRGVLILARMIAEIAHSETGIDIHPGAEIGDSFFIDHGAGVVIGETTRIGRHVRLYQGVTLGAKRFEKDETGALKKGAPRHPIIEDEVVIYAGAAVLGRITVGRGSSIGGNVWLTHSVPPGSNITQAKARVDTFGDGGGI